MAKLSENALEVLRQRYFLKDAQGNCLEEGPALFRRVADAVALAEKKAHRKKWADAFFEFMNELRFLPNSPTLMNAGRPQGQLSACYVLPIRDSLADIFETLKNAALIHQSGGGTGFSFTRLRPEGALVKTTHGVASGPISFLKIFDAATETIKQGGTRRGANMAILNADHPDIFKFIECKRDLKSVTNFNISIGATERFMEEALEPGSKARKVFDQACEAAWVSGDPGLIFLDRINLFNPTPKEGDIESTNPCGEQPLLPYESCNLGSLNLGKYVENKKSEFDWNLFRQDIELAVRFLDDVIDVNHYPIRACAKITLKNRKTGLGVMGFADLLLALGVSYASPEAVSWAGNIMSFLDRNAKATSAKLAKERGAFPGWKGSLWEQLSYPKMRNATVSTIAPTGTISIIAGASSGIEPVFSENFVRNVLSGAKLREDHPETENPAWAPAHQVSVEQHIRIQAEFQKFSDSSVSKTINLPEHSTVEDVKRAYFLAYKLGCKGITVYRDKSRPAQVLEKTSCPEC